ncbi:GerMN domain-containing protein [Aneurinibacillus tyrosinisolvens]|uniref:GerMN domain-containing protein n=1 Tax=Aneurinibacillus tyrosinisolvens TaxID=1443435 RepID=UPI00069C31A3|nr:GerMN domain-containing protein [Aneurinibacillus tyrosinisolvens]
MRFPRVIPVMALMLLTVAGCSTPTQSTNPAPADNNQGVTAQQNNTNSQQPQQTQPQDQTQAQPAEQPKNAAKAKEVVLVFSDDNLMDQYKETHAIQYEDEKDLPMLALKQWQKGPKSKKLIPILPESVKIQSIKKEGATAVVSLSSEVKNANLGSSGEEFMLQEIATILGQFGYKNTKIEVDGKETDTILGHMDTTQPIEPMKLSELKEAE